MAALPSLSAFIADDIQPLNGLTQHLTTDAFFSGAYEIFYYTMADFIMKEVKTEELSVHEQVNRKCLYVIIFNQHTSVQPALYS
jgi:replicative DNA helicase